MKKNIFDLFLEKIFIVPLWVKQVIYLRLRKIMEENLCKEFLDNNADNVFSTHIPTLTFKGKTELMERQCGLDNNIYNFLQACSTNQSIIEICVNMFLSMEEVSKYYELCIEQNFLKTPESREIHAMAGFISGKLRTGEYFKQKGQITVDQLQIAILKQREMPDKKFGEILLELDYIQLKDLKSVLILKEEAKKRFILDYNTVPNSQTAFSSNNEEYAEEIKNLKEENLKLKKKMLQLLELVKKNAK